MEKIINDDKKVEILAQSGTVLKYDLLHYYDVMTNIEDEIKKRLLDRFYSEYLQTGKEYKCKLRIKRTNEEESEIIKINAYLYVKECEEDERTNWIFIKSNKAIK